MPQLILKHSAVQCSVVTVCVVTLWHTVQTMQCKVGTVVAGITATREKHVIPSSYRLYTQDYSKLKYGTQNGGSEWVSAVQYNTDSERQCGAVQCIKVQCSAVHYSAVQCSALKCSAVQCITVQCSAVQSSAVQCSAVRYSAGYCSAVKCRAHIINHLTMWQPDTQIQTEIMIKPSVNLQHVENIQNQR